MLTESPQPNLGSADARSLRWRFWLLTPLTGLCAGLAAGLLMLLLRRVETLVWGGSASETFLDAVEAVSPATRIGVLIGAGVLVAAGRWCLRRATGGHAAEVTEAIWFRSGAIPFWRTLVQAILSIVIVGLGASLGREAAPKQMGAAFAALFARWTKLSPSHARLLAAYGAGAGIAAVYNVPLGGALFALEVLLGTLSLPLIPPALVASGVATAAAWLLLTTAPTYQIGFDPASPALIVWALLFGPLAGVLSAAYVRLIVWSDALKPRTRWRRLATPVLVFLCLGALSVPLPQALGNGKDVVQLAFAGDLTLPLLVALVILKPLATAACLGSGAPGGLFTPTLTLGAVFGGFCGLVWGYVWPDATLGAYAVVGAAAVLAAATQGPVSAIVLVLELTRRLDTLMVPVVLATAGAVLVSRLIDNRSLYSGRIHAGRSAADKSVQPGIVLSAAARYAEVLRALMRASSLKMPVRVVDNRGEFLGEIDAERAQDPRPADFPLETATAADFVKREEPAPASSGHRPPPRLGTVASGP